MSFTWKGALIPQCTIGVVAIFASVKSFSDACGDVSPKRSASSSSDHPPCGGMTGSPESSLRRRSRLSCQTTSASCNPSSKDSSAAVFREALGYFCGLIPYLKNYIQHPYAHMDNNAAERAARAVALGRKNWLFVGNEDGGEAAAILLSLVQSCRAVGVNPREYLEDVMRRLMSHIAEKLPHLRTLRISFPMSRQAVIKWFWAGRNFQKRK